PPRMMLRTFFMGRPRQGRRWRVSYHAFEGGKSNPRTALKPTRGPGWAFERYHLRPFAPAFPLVPCNRSAPPRGRRSPLGPAPDTEPPAPRSRRPAPGGRADTAG